MLSLRNQFIMPPIKLGYSNGSGIVTEKHLKFYSVRSKYIGALTYEPLYMDTGLREIPTQLGIDKDDKINGLAKLNELVHKNGAKTIAHLNHPGRMANPKIPGNYWFSASAIACENGGATPKEMNHNDIEIACKQFVDAATRAQKANFDYIELQFGHGYLVAQFLSPAVNKRLDEYGGNLKNRMQFALKILKSVQKAVDLPIIIRISGDEMIPDGYHLPEMIDFVNKLKTKNIAAIHVSAGNVCSTPPWFFQHMFVPKGITWEFAEKIKTATGVPTIFVGKINSGKDVNHLLIDKKADFIAIGRALVADPYFVGKYTKEHQGNIRPCLACSEGCLGGVRSGKGLGCVVNPMVGNEEIIIKEAETPKCIAVIGGGLAGMEAAITLHQRGHKVDLFEKNELGGQFNLAYLPPKKESLKDIVDYYKNELTRFNIQIYKKEAKEKDLLGVYDVVILATGAIPTIPPIKGLKEYYWTEFLHDDSLPEKSKVMVIGGGLIGIEVASKLADKENKLIIVEMLAEMARGMEMIEKKMTLQKLNSKQAELYVNTKVVEVKDKEVIVEKADGKQISFIVDKIVVTTGMISYHPLFDKLNGKIPVYLVGDAKKVAKAQEAIHEAYDLATSI